MLLQRPDHRVERVGDADNKRLGRIFFDTLADLFHHGRIDADEIVAAHPRFAGDAGGNNDDVRILDTGVGISARDLGIETFNGRRFDQVEGFPLRSSFHDIEKNDVTELFESSEMGKGAADIAGADEGDFVAGHECFRKLLWKKL